MTLIVAVNVADGLVIAGDSYQTFEHADQYEQNGEGYRYVPPSEHKDGNWAVPWQSLSPFLATKVISVFDRFGVAAYGQVLLGDQPILSQINKRVDEWFPRKNRPRRVSALASKIRDWVTNHHAGWLAEVSKRN